MKQNIDNNHDDFSSVVYVTYGVRGEDVRHCVKCSSMKEACEIRGLCRERVPCVERVRINRSLRVGDVSYVGADEFRRSVY